MRYGPALAALLVLASVPAARAADSVADFYRKTPLTMQIGSGPAGGYDVVGRLVARNLGRYIPGHPTVIVQNVPGGGSLVLANQFGNTTKNDGSVIGVMNSGMATTPLLEPEAVHFDPRKFGFLGSPATEIEILVVWHTAPIRRPEDLFKKTLIVGATSPGSATFDIPYLTNALLGTKFKIIPGYVDSNSIKIALERGEVQGDASLGLSSLKTQFEDLYATHKLLVIAQYGLEPSASLPHTPLFPIGDSATTRQMLTIAFARSSYGQPFVTPPGVPKDRFEALRKAFAATMKDPQFLAEAQKANVTIEPIPGAKLQALTDQIFATPPDVLKRLQDLIAQEGKI